MHYTPPHLIPGNMQVHTYEQCGIIRSSLIRIYSVFHEQIKLSSAGQGLRKEDNLCLALTYIYTCQIKER